MAFKTIEKPTTRGPGDGTGTPWRVIVVNDNHNTFDWVAMALSRHLPGITLEAGYEFATAVHSSGSATVWTGQFEPAEHYWDQLNRAGLTMAPLERC